MSAPHRRLEIDISLHPTKVGVVTLILRDTSHIGTWLGVNLTPESARLRAQALLMAADQADAAMQDGILSGRSNVLDKILEEKGMAGTPRKPSTEAVSESGFTRFSQKQDCPTCGGRGWVFAKATDQFAPRWLRCGCVVEQPTGQVK